MKYNRYDTGGGEIWLVGENDSLNNIYVSSTPTNRGFGGTKMSFDLDDDTTVTLIGPNHSNSDALYNATGIDLKKKDNTHYIKFEIPEEYKRIRKLNTGLKDVRDIIAMSEIKNMENQDHNKLINFLNYLIETIDKL